MIRSLFTAQGRISRKAFWLTGLCWFGIIGALAVVLAIASSMDDAGAVIVFIGSFVFLGLMIAATWSGITLGIRRYHDLGKPGIWVLIQLVPIVGFIWYVIEAGFKRGTAGPNIYGPDPLGSIAGPAGDTAPLPMRS